MDLGGWLRSLGLEQYEAALYDNAIDEKVLPRLTLLPRLAFRKNITIPTVTRQLD